MEQGEKMETLNIIRNFVANLPSLDKMADLEAAINKAVSLIKRQFEGADETGHLFIAYEQISVDKLVDKFVAECGNDKAVTLCGTRHYKDSPRVDDNKIGLYDEAVGKMVEVIDRWDTENIIRLIGDADIVNLRIFCPHCNCDGIDKAYDAIKKISKERPIIAIRWKPDRNITNLEGLKWWSEI